MKFNFAFLLFLSCAVVTAPAQTPSDSSADSATDHFRTFVTQGIIQNLFYSQVSPPPLPTPDYPNPLPDPKFKETPLWAFSNVKSALYPLNKTKPLYIFTHKTDEKGKLIYPLVASLDLSKSPAIPLLFFQPIPNLIDSYKIDVFGDDEKSFPGGALRFINLSSIPLDVTVSESTAALNPKDSHLFTPTPHADAQILDIKINRQADQNLQYSNRWGYRPDVRALVVVINDPGNPKNVISFHIFDSTTTLATSPPPP